MILNIAVQTVVNVVVQQILIYLKVYDNVKIQNLEYKPPVVVVVFVFVVVVVVVEYPILFIYIIVELDDLTGARFVLFFTVFSQRTCSKPLF